MNFDHIEKLIQMTDASDLTEVTIQDKGFQITLKKEKARVQTVQEPISNTTVAAEEAPVALPVEKSIIDKNISTIKAPMVGVYYAAPGPEQSPFVSVGKEVNKGDVVCILEAMKLMNDVESDFTGTIVKILVNNGETVEYGQPLFEIRVAP